MPAAVAFTFSARVKSRADARRIELSGNASLRNAIGYSNGGRIASALVT